MSFDKHLFIRKKPRRLLHSDFFFQKLSAVKTYLYLHCLMKNVFENEDTQEREGYLQARENVNDQYALAHELAKEKQTREVTHWTDSFKNAAKYSKGAVVEIIMDDLPPHFQHYKGVCEGDAAHGTFSEWVLPRDYFENRVSCFVEEVKVIAV